MNTSSLLRPGVSLRRGADRRQTRIGWLHGRHSFDTGVDPLGDDTHHGVLVVSNHDTIAPGSGFETHPHRNVEIVTWVLNGALVYQDSEGHAGVIYPNLAQRMTAGTGRRRPGCAVRSRLRDPWSAGPRGAGLARCGGRGSSHRSRRAPPRRCRTQRGPDLGDACLPEPGSIRLALQENSMSRVGHRIEMSGDLHEYGALGRVTKTEALKVV
jgi:Pirin